MSPASPARSCAGSWRQTGRTRSGGSCPDAFQAELRKPFVKIAEEPFGITEVLETDHEVVREPHDDHVTVRVAASPPVAHWSKT